MTTCAEAAQGDLWATGGYIDWTAVHKFLWVEYQRLEAAPIPEATGNAVLILTCLEMLFGTDVLAPTSYPSVRDAYPPGERFEDGDLLQLLKWVVQGQWMSPGLGFTASGDEGWWFDRDALTGDPSPLHFLPRTADSWMALRRNATGVEALAQEGLVPAPLEHKLLPSAVFSPAGDLVDIYAWMDLLEETGAVPGPLNPPTGPQQYENFWGEWIGAVALFQSLQDTADQLGAAGPMPHGVPPLQPGTGMGLELVSAFRWWQQRRNPRSIHPDSGAVTPGPVWEASEANPTDPAPDTLGGWVGSTRPLGLFAPFILSSVFHSHPSWYVPPFADPAAGQDWDASLHQLSRAVLTMHHVGYGLTAFDKLVVLIRLWQWSRPGCETHPAGACPAGASLATEGDFLGAPRETYVWRSELKCVGESAAPGLAVTQTHDLVDVLSAALALVRGQVLGGFPLGDLSGATKLILANCLITAGTRYRDDPTVSGASGWAVIAPGDPTGPGSEAPSLGGTYAAIALLLLLERAPFWGCANLDGLPPAASPSTSLDSFLHIFGGNITSLLGAHPWNPSHVPG